MERGFPTGLTMSSHPGRTEKEWKGRHDHLVYVENLRSTMSRLLLPPPPFVLRMHQVKVSLFHFCLLDSLTS